MSTTATPEQLLAEFKELRAELAVAANERKQHGDFLGDTKAKFDAINARMDAIEVALKRPNLGDVKRILGAEKASSPERKAAQLSFYRKGAAFMTPEERKFLSASDDTTGGYLQTDEEVAEIIKDVVEWSPMRQVARIRTTSQRAVKIRKRTQTTAAVWLGAERRSKSETQGLRYGLEEVPNHELYAFSDISVQDIEDSSFDIEGELRMDYAEQFGVAEAQGFLTGSGNGEPEGVLTNSDISEDVTTHATNLTHVGLVNVSHNLKSAFARNATFAFNRKTLGKIRLMEDGAGNPLWVPMAQGAPSTVLGMPYVEFPDLADVGAGAYPVLCGDFKRGYLIVDRIQISILRDELTQAAEGAVRFIARKRVGGQVVLASAIRKLKVSA